jgi:DNA excision repair protein ERCC-2
MSDESQSEDSPPVPDFVTEENPNESHEVVDVSQDTGDSQSTSTREVQSVPLDELNPDWRPYFRYDQAYQDQVDSIDSIVATLSENGYHAFEGACGTGKTLAAVTAGIHSIRDQRLLSNKLCGDESGFPDYSQLLVVTPLKQQLTQFVEEMRGINSSLSSDLDSVPTVILRSRGDMMVYSQADVALPGEGSFNENVDQLRDMTRKVIQFDSNIPLDWPDGMSPSEHSYSDYDWDDASDRAENHRDRYRYDPERAEAVTRILSNLQSMGGSDVERLTVDGVEAPYPSRIPHTRAIADQSRLADSSSQLPTDLQGKFEPFYAGAFAGYGGLRFGFEDADQNVFDRDNLFEVAVQHGVCPHEAMATLAGSAEVVLGNYYHLFDPQTRLLTGEKIGILDDDTIVAVDEAHQIESRVRDILSDSVSAYSLNQAANDIEIARNYLRGEYEKTPTEQLRPEDKRKVEGAVEAAFEPLGSSEEAVDKLSKVKHLIEQVRQTLVTEGSNMISDRFESVSWYDAMREYNWNVGNIEKPMDDDSQQEEDRLIRELQSKEGVSPRQLLLAEAVGRCVTEAFDLLDKAGIVERETTVGAVGNFLKRWRSEDDVEYHREAVLEHSRKDEIPNEYPEWVSEWTPKYQLYNCIPRTELRAVFGELGGGVLMSATLQPEEVFTEAVGVDDIPLPDEDDTNTEQAGSVEDEPSNEDSSVSIPTQPSTESDTADDSIRTSRFETYPMRFPVENRFSCIADLPAYTSRNREEPTTNRDEMSSVRKRYADLILDLIQTKGNILVSLPNYNEAEWAYNLANDTQAVDKRLHCDQSSSAIETTENLKEFFADGEAVMFTSTRSTIVEGVDYDGGKLHGCLVIGIPLLQMSERNNAVIDAYARRMSTGSGFETAMKIPAVRKARQTIGRVIRGTAEPGWRILADKRYASSNNRGANQYLTDQQQAEFTASSTPVGDVEQFWSRIEDTPLSLYDTDDDNPDTHDESETTTVADEGHPEDDDTSEVKEQSDAAVWKDSDEVTHSKVYFGSGANLSGWIPVRTDVVRKKIVPLVQNNSPAETHIKMNFASEIGINGWTKVEHSTVVDKIEPLAEEHSA